LCLGGTYERISYIKEIKIIIIRRKKERKKEISSRECIDRLAATVRVYPLGTGFVSGTYERIPYIKEIKMIIRRRRKKEGKKEISSRECIDRLAATVRVYPLGTGFVSGTYETIPYIKEIKMIIRRRRRKKEGKKEISTRECIDRLAATVRVYPLGTGFVSGTYERIAYIKEIKMIIRRRRKKERKR
jgi:inorganic pyrophosphatase